MSSAAIFVWRFKGYYVLQMVFMFFSNTKTSMMICFLIPDVEPQLLMLVSGFKVKMLR